MIYSDTDIKKAIRDKTIVIEPYDSKCLGGNSYDVHLSKHLATYDWTKCSHIKIPSSSFIGENTRAILDAKNHNQIKHFDIPKEGFVMLPGILYLGSTIEYTETHNCVPFLEGKSSTGRLGINIHATAGKGDVGFCNHWTLELSCIHPVRIYDGMPIGQLIYFETKSPASNKYSTKINAKYIDKSKKPQESKMYMNDF